MTRFLAAALTLVFALACIVSNGLAQPSAPARIRLVAHGEPVRDVFLRLSDLGHLSITVAEEVHGNVDLSLHDVTPVQALHAICLHLRLHCASDGHTVLVSTQSTAVVPLSIASAARAAKVVHGLFP